MQHKNLVYIILTLIFIILSIGILTYVLTNKDLTANPESLSEKVGAVEITATPKLDDSGYEFNITLNTHSTELNYDLVSVSSLTNEKGQTIKPSNWQGDGPGGHHREGKLIFPKFNNRPKILNLTINEIGEKGVNFEWKL